MIKRIGLEDERAKFGVEKKYWGMKRVHLGKENLHSELERAKEASNCADLTNPGAG